MGNRIKKRFIAGGILAAAVLSLMGCGKAKDGGEAADFSDSGQSAVTGSGLFDSVAVALPEKMPSFSAVDLEGNTVTEELFAEKDLTVVNIWGTFCPPCIEEMPELGEWAGELPENVQIVGLICDIAGEEDTEHHDLAVEITEKAGAAYTQIIANEDFAPIMNWVTGVPTTLFVDGEGNIVGEPVVGAYVEDYQAFVEEYLNEQ